MNWKFLESQIETLKSEIESFESVSEKDVITHLYKNVLLFYLQSDNVNLQKYTKLINQISETSILSMISLLRLQIRTNSVNEDLVKKINDENCLKLEDALVGEKFFVLGLAYELCSKYNEMKTSYEKSYVYFKRAGLQHKAIKSLHNAVTANSNLKPSPFFLNEYQRLFIEAQNLGNIEMAAMALYNISVHFYKLKAMQAALKNIKLSEEYAKNLSFNRNKYLIYLHICRIHAHLKTLDYAQEYLEFCLLSPFEDIKSTAKVLVEEGKTTMLHPPTSWRDYLSPKVVLTKKETQLLDLLIEQERTKHELAEKIFGTQINLSSALNSLNNLVTRLRKKTKLKIIFSENVFRLSLFNQKTKRVGI